ncbi:MAG: hypothetical protein DCC55_35375 [Chloroflexi bacterium]|nr:MAG: hypothetical protein DCC55_35375 [Chloroflexota bacterium]
MSDDDGGVTDSNMVVAVQYNWNGFLQPVENLPTVNIVNAGQAIPVKFSLGGDFGLDIFAGGYPASQNVACGEGGSGSNPVEETVTAGRSELQFDPATQTYTYVWKTDRSWAGTCRQLTVRLKNGTEQAALFHFNGKGGRSAWEQTEDEPDQPEPGGQQHGIFLPLVTC